MLTTGARWCHRLGLPVLAGLTLVSLARAGWLWEPKGQVTQATPPLYDPNSGSGTRGHSPATTWQSLVRVQESPDTPAGNQALAYYLVLGADWDPAGSWASAELVTDTTSGHRTTDLNIAVGADDDAYVAMEVFYWDPGQPLGESTEPRVGFRHRNGSTWGAVHIISPDSVNRGFDSPNIALQDSESDTLHVMFRHRATATIWHTRKAVTDPDASWEAATPVTSTIGDLPAGSSHFAVGSNGQVHFFGRERFPNAGGALVLRQWHFRGYPPGTGAWDLDSVLVAEHVTPPLGQPLVEGPPEVQGVYPDGSTFHWVWAAGQGDGTNAIFYSRGDAGGDWLGVGDDGVGNPIQVTASNGHAYAPEVWAEGEVIHVLYHEGGPPNLEEPPPTDVLLMHVRSTDDGVTWSRPEEVSAGARTVAFRPTGFAEADTLFLVLTSHDDDDPTPGSDGEYELWAQKGYAVADTLESANVTWSGVVYLDSDFEVQAGTTLTIEPGTQVFAAASSGSEKVELIVHGELLADGELDDPIIFRSYDGEGGPGDWGGIVFDLEAAPSGYGFTCSSHLYHTRIEDATAGVVMRRTGAPSMINVMFADIEGDRHILVDSTDVYVPYGGTWDLRAPTTVKAAAGIRSGSEIGTANGKVEIVVQGTMITAAPQGGWVKFEPVDVPTTATSGDEWGGLFFDWLSTGSLLESADIGYARTPISLFWQDATIRWSRIHHFADRAVWAGSSKSTGPRLLENTVFRDTTGTAMLSESKGHNGIVLNNVSDALISENVISLAGMTSTTAGGAAILVQNSAGKYGFCDQTSATPDTLAIADNHILGSGAAANTGLVKWSGISGDWFCGAGPRKAVVTGNVIRHWNGSGIDLVQAEDVQFTCNDVDSCFRAVNFSRDALDSVGVRFKNNALRTADDNQLHNQESVRSDSAPWLQLGPAGTTRGSNFLETRGFDWYVVEEDPSATPLNAVQNRWRRSGILHTTPDSVLTYISGQVSVTPLASSWTQCGGFAAEAPPAVTEMGDGHERDLLRQLDAEGGSLPERTRLVALRSPQGGAEVRFDLAGTPRRDVQVDVFNVAGRRVARLVDEPLPGGRYGVSWSGRDGSGGRVGSGVYLVRMRAGSESFVAKTVLLR